ncbi:MULTISPECIES: quinone-dependent dihydroorotate dehydrogenase [unclassified Actinomyces]|uniref:quinone-dependent dihydroorotate dehydrogenase n=1 Tax=unclassified Actinomyces TaxID=2609248 RepID=UPI002016D805|nr:MULTISPECIES: quinone-dependent dihydroorotate dehydrogenase [unclassified Actinomyces]MCL3777923.1 quinone-dependent dihydroorotate dehydrogenase [Actinomyces sp. AC-20-1]MCL3788803.1 quinone-dependent dihydroorotate dehydrogenase [Actinomyces sp. 187325]MCL3791139.1 quinone-dependent dihydroorotate dehydrogenase [Actinomyces sp. 186855]MCL3793700.1 quinone-dependent dihydroorotate dehydrogenase [Actinomyces sp. 217892]
MLYHLLYSTVLTRIDPEVIHDVVVRGLGVAQRVPFARDVIRQAFGRRPAFPVPSSNQGGPLARPVPGVLGLAAGMDKEGEVVEAMDMLGFGFVEVGTFTAQPQPGNDKPRMWRYPHMRAIRNRMGFNNHGADAAARRLRELRSSVRGRSIVVGANIGKTKAVALADAVEDYRYSASRVARWVDYLVVNVSSPNTPGLRTLQDVETLRPILAAVREAADAAAHRHVPLLVKIAPDLADEDVDAVADLVLDMGLDGVVATNTTIDHDLGEGGLSGAPLLPRSLEVVRRLRARLGEEPAIIGVGGISSVMDAELMLDAGADLLQAYTAFIYNGPAWPGRLNRALATTRRAR